MELCSDMIDVVLDVSGIYGIGSTGKKNAGNNKLDTQPSALGASLLEDGKKEDGDELFDSTEEANHALSGGGVDPDDSNVLDASAASNEGAGEDELLGKLVGQSPPSVEEEDEEANDADGGSAYDSASSSTIHLSNGMVLYLKEVDTMLALVCLTRAENFRKKSLINYNIGCLKKALQKLPQSTQSVGGV